MSKIEKIKLKEIHYNPYKEYLKSNKNILKWFSWNLTNTTKNHSYFFIYFDTKLAGAISTLRDDEIFVDIFITKPFTRKRIATNVLKKLKNLNSDKKLLFKVSRYNKESLIFFDKLASEFIESKKHKNNNFFVYKM